MDALAADLMMMLAVAGRVCAGLVFVAAAIAKLRHRSVLPAVIANYRLLPEPAVAWVARLLPPGELALGLLLLSGLGGAFIAVLAMLLLGVFARAMAINIKRGRSHIDCGCGHSLLRQNLRWSLVVRNMVLTALLLPSLAGVGTVPVAVLLAGIGAGTTFYLLYAAANALAALPRAERLTPRAFGTGHPIGAH